MMSDSPDTEESELVAEVIAKVSDEEVMIGFVEVRIACHEFERVGTRLVEDRGVGKDVGHPEFRQTALPGAKEISGSAELKIDFGDRKPIIGRYHRGQSAIRKMLLVDQEVCRSRIQSPPRPVTGPPGGKEDTERLFGPSPYPPPELVEL